jgi:hypothetical protein
MIQTDRTAPYASRPVLVEAIPAAPPYAVTHIGFDSEYGWAVEVANSSQLTDGQVAPVAKDLPPAVREALLKWLGAI